MQLILKRAQRDSGLISKTVVFSIQARVQLTPEESHAVQRYKLGPMVVFDSQSRIDLTERAAQRVPQRQIDYHGSVGGMLASGAASMFSGAFSAGKALALAGLASLKLRITINSLLQGQLVECKDMDELLGAEEAIHQACQNLRRYIDVASTFDGRHVLISYDSDEPVIIGQTEPQQVAHQPSESVVYQSDTAPHIKYSEPEPDPVLTHHPMAQAYADMDNEGYADTYEAPPSNYQSTFNPSEWLNEHWPKVAGAIVALVIVFGIYVAVAHRPARPDDQLPQDATGYTGPWYYVNGVRTLPTLVQAYDGKKYAAGIPCPNPTRRPDGDYDCDQ